MMRLLIAVVLVLMPYTLMAQTLDLAVQINDDPTEFRWSQDEWLAEDKVDHFIGGMGTMLISSTIFRPTHDSDVWETAGYNVAFWTIWEIKDAWYPWEAHGYWGGDGFSYKDAVTSALGVAVATAIVFVVKR